MATILYPTADTYIPSSGGNYGTADYLIPGHLNVLGTQVNTRALLRFDLSAYEADDIGSAVLRLSLASTNFVEGPHTVYAHGLTTTAWVDTQATWTIYATGLNWTTAGGDYNATPDATAIIEQGDTELFIDLTELATSSAGGNMNVLIKLVDASTDTTTHNLTAYSVNYATVGDRPQLTVSASSQHMACAVAVKEAIQALDLAGVDPDNVKVRKFPHFRKDLDTLPLVLVTTHLPVTTAPATNLRDDITYPVTVSLFAQSDASQTLNHKRMLLWRETIRKTFHQKRLSGVDSVWTCNIPQSQPFNEAWFIGGMKDQSPLTLNFISRELRS